MRGRGSNTNWFLGPGEIVIIICQEGRQEGEEENDVS